MKKPLSLILGLGLFSNSLLAAPLSPENFLEQVKNQNEGLRGAQESEKGATLRQSEAGLIFSPTLFMSTQVIDDKKPTASIASQGDETKLKVAELGISQATRIGLSGKLSYTLADTTILHTNPAYLPRPSFTDSSVKLELNQALWQNSFGHQWRQAEKATEASIKSTSLAKRFESQMILLDAEAKYWKLAAIRENISILKGNLERTKKVLEFNKVKVQRNLTDATDLLQSQALVRSRILDLQNALDEEKDAMRAFNATRTLDSDQVTEELQFPSFDSIIKKLEAARPHEAFRNDIKAAEEGLKALQASQAISKDKTRPDLNLFAVGSLNSRENTNSDAVNKSFDSNHPYYAVGLRLSMPLDFSTRSNIQSAYEQESFGAQLSYQKKKYDQEAEWKSLQNRMQLIRQRLVLAKELKEAQSAKLENERQRQANGRSTTFQVFSFEQEYLASELNLVQIQTAALMLLAQEKTFRDLE